MIRLLFIVPYPELKEKVETVMKSHPEKKRLDVQIRVMTVEETPDVPADEYDAIIARGYTANKTTEMYKNVPTVDLAISGYDIFQAIYECSETYHPKKIAICSFSGRIYEVRSMCEHFGIQAEVYAPADYKELPETMEKIQSSGCEVIVGGYSINILAKKKHVPSVIIKTGENTILHTVNEAIRTVDRLRAEKVISQMYKTVIYESRDGVMYVDRDGFIRVRNQEIRKMNGDVSIKDKKISDTFPYLVPIYRSVVASGQQEDGRILTIPKTKLTVSVRCTPVIANKEISGAVISLSDVSMIQHLEGQIRQKLGERGLKARYHFEDIIHESDVIEQTIQTAKKYAVSESNVIVVGETGTGKELFAQSIHNSSKRKNGPFVAINCAALPENLLESELFGYVEGAFTGTVKGGKMGLFEQAHGGTLFLDEIGEISLPIQSKLLRVLQEKQVRRIGDNKVIDIDVRIIAATNRSLPQLCEKGTFRRDLMYRLDVLRLFIVPLRERKNDVELLFQHLLKPQCKEQESPMVQMEPAGYRLLHEYPFTGNIRELKNIVERATVFCKDGIITVQNLTEALYPPDFSTDISKSEIVNIAEELPQSEEERIRKALRLCDGSKTKAAKLLDMDRSTLWRKLQKYEIE
ncbi:MAG: sigma 54-interacting transcriptional regulator [Lachnospiraceae bacterium]|nr:sigma 54-interacting transcriptional regulator [Lachnospiraceae bacterium]